MANISTASFYSAFSTHEAGQVYRRKTDGRQIRLVSKLPNVLIVTIAVRPDNVRINVPQWRCQRVDTEASIVVRADSLVKQWELVT